MADKKRKLENISSAPEETSGTETKLAVEDLMTLGMKMQIAVMDRMTFYGTELNMDAIKKAYRNLEGRHVLLKGKIKLDFKEKSWDFFYEFQHHSDGGWHQSTYNIHFSAAETKQSLKDAQLIADVHKACNLSERLFDGIVHAYAMKFAEKNCGDDWPKVRKSLQRFHPDEHQKYLYEYG